VTVRRLCSSRLQSGSVMTLHDNAYAAFMLDYAAGALAPAERLAADLHVSLSCEGRCSLSLLEAIGGRMLEAQAPAPIASGAAGPPEERPGPSGACQLPSDGRHELRDRLLRSDLVALSWRRGWFGVGSLPVGVPDARLLRLDPRQRAPQHGHHRRDVTVVIHGSFADEFGVYERGDLAFAEPGMKHEPRALGDTPCICLIATERRSGWTSLLPSFAVAGSPSGHGATYR
jgi:putative transcriptional regulator